MIAGRHQYIAAVDKRDDIGERRRHAPFDVAELRCASAQPLLDEIQNRLIRPLHSEQHRLHATLPGAGDHAGDPIEVYGKMPRRHP